MKSIKRIIQKWSIALKILPLIILVTALKFGTHKFGFEVMELNALFSSLVAGTIFLIGFLISGVLTDYKESEKLPSELAAGCISGYCKQRKKMDHAHQGLGTHYKSIYY